MNTIDNQTTANQISVGVVDMFLYLYVENYDDIVNKTNEYTFLNYSGIMKTMQGSVNADNPIFSFPKERRYNFITCAFIQQQATIKNTLTDLGGIRFDQALPVEFSSTAVKILILRIIKTYQNKLVRLLILALLLVLFKRKKVI